LLGLKVLRAITRVAEEFWGAISNPELQSETIREKPVLSCSMVHMIFRPSS
jgi:hypothetical protein